MSAYDHLVIVTVPASLGGVAAAVGRALDPDVGGADSFVPQPDGTLRAAAWSVREYAQALPYLVADPAALHASVVLDYQQRWPALSPPPLAAITDFCAAAELQIIKPA